MVIDQKAFHPVCDVFPKMSKDDFVELVLSIKRNGQRNPIILAPDGRIVDGRHRYEACQELGIAPIYKSLKESDSLIEFVIDQNLKRRHLSATQRAMTTSVAQPYFDAERREDERNRPTVAKRAAAAEVSERTQKEADKVRDEGIPELVNLALADAIPAHLAAKVAELPKKEQEAICRSVDPKVSAKLAVSPAGNRARGNIPNKPKPEHDDDLPESDAVGNLLPKTYAAIFSGAAKFKETLSAIDVARKMVAALAETAPGAWLRYDAQSIESHLKAARYSVRKNAPHALCPTCVGARCKDCKKIGWMPSVLYDLQTKTAKG